MSEISVFTGPTSVSDDQLRIQKAQRSTAYDPVDKLRVSTPQSLIDTDFEYGQQSTKWEQLAMQNNRPSTYYFTNSPLAITTVTSASVGGITYSGTVVTVNSTANPAVGTPIFIEDSLDPNANGWWLVASTSGSSFTYNVINAPTYSGNLYNVTATYVYQGYFYTNVGISVAASSTSAITVAANIITVNTTYPHGLSVGSLVYIANTTGGTNVNGAFIVATTPTTTSFTITTTNASGTVTTAATAKGSVYARVAGYVDTHAYDGSVNFTAGASVPGAVLQRQTRRYFRYQSGKGIQFSTGTILKPELQQSKLTSSGSTVTVTTTFSHNMTVGAYVKVVGADQSAYNGIFQILTVPSALTFTYKTLNGVTPSASPATATIPSILHVSPYSWYGSSNRFGLFDQQNGLFFKFDGQTLSAVYRSSIYQITGTASVSQGSALVTGTGTQFSNQLVVGDNIVIRGQSYTVTSITSDTALYISPEYRGNNAQTLGGVAQTANVIISRTIDVSVPQSQWFDPLDGTGPSGYVLDLTKVQMFYIDYSWYGAGVARFGIRTTGGAITYIYAFQNNNVNYSAYMRSGNLPSHYEQNAVAPVTSITSNVGIADTTINVVSTTGFNPNGGKARIIGGGTAAAIEYVTYTGITSKSLTGVTRGQAGGASATAFTYSASAPIAVEYYVADSAAQLSHWGSAVIMEGGYTQDVSLIFNYGTLATVSVPATTSVPILAIRVAPSVDNGTTGTLGLKEVMNRLQLQLVELGVVTSGTFLIQLVLNGYTTGTPTWSSFQSPTQNNTSTSSICQVASQSATTATFTGGESIAAAYTNSSGQTTLDLRSVAGIGNAAMGGGISNTVPTSYAGQYPDGPDVLYVVAYNTAGTASTIVARLSWQESQA